MGLEITFPCDREGVLALLPHRDPFVWVSRVASCKPGESIVAELDVDPALPLFAGHFPGHPVLPGVILMEALAQAACCCLLSEEGQASVTLPVSIKLNSVEPCFPVTLSLLRPSSRAILPECVLPM